jgi:hypothetical protein
MEGFLTFVKGAGVALLAVTGALVVLSGLAFIGFSIVN